MRLCSQNSTFLARAVRMRRDPRKSVEDQNTGPQFLAMRRERGTDVMVR